MSSLLLVVQAPLLLFIKQSREFEHSQMEETLGNGLLKFSIVGIK